jgi:sugar phosphate isomerase/epimerase
MSGRPRTPYASTTCLSGRGYVETLDAYAAADVERVELGYCPETVDLSAVVEEYPFEFVAHNYCLPRDEPFVLNLASPDEHLRRRSIEYVEEAVEFCDTHGIDQYTFHAGFRADPDLSFSFPDGPLPSFEASFERFCTALETVLSATSETDVGLAVENNVVEPQHVIDGEPVVLVCTPGEVAELYERTEPFADRLGLLLDTGHAHVAASTLGFDLDQFLVEVSPNVGALHLHRNDGFGDQHRPITPDCVEFEMLQRFPDVTRTTEAKFEDVRALKRHLDWLRSRP